MTRSARSFWSSRTQGQRSRRVWRWLWRPVPETNVTVVVADVVDAADAIGGGPTQTSFYGAAAERFMEGLESA